MLNDHQQVLERGAAISTPRLQQTLLSGFFCLLWFFCLAIAGTWVGITQSAAAEPALMVLALLITAWLLRRSPVASSWHATSLDRVIPLWLLAFAVSTVANWPQHTHILTGLWFSALYILLWYVVSDSLANRLFQPGSILNGLLLAGVPLMVSALFEPAATRIDGRVAGLLRNSNILGTFLVLMIPLIVGRLIEAKGLARLTYGLYGLMATVTLALSQSRGGVFGVCCSFGVLLSLRATRRWQRLLLVIGAVAVVLLLLALRGDTGRVPIYEQAISVLSSRFLTGEGLFTFRSPEVDALDRLRLPPDGQNLHAHNLWLQISVELGVLGTLALAATFVQFARAVPETMTRRWCLAVIVGLLGQQMVDFTIMTPGIAICAIILLAIAVSGEGVQRSNARWMTYLFIALLMLLLATGFITGPVPRALL